MSAFVSVSFWGLYFVDRDLIYPVFLDALIPSWYNHVVHTMVFVAMLAEMLLVRPKHPQRRTGLLVVTAFTLLYISWVHYIFYRAGFWVYPVLGVLNALNRSLFIVGCVACAFTFYLLGEKLNTCISPRRVEARSSGGRKNFKGGRKDIRKD